MSIFDYCAREIVRDPQGRRFCVLTIDLSNYLGIANWVLIEDRIKRFHNFVSPEEDEKAPVICIENDNKGDAAKSHINLCKLIENGYMMGF